MGTGAWSMFLLPGETDRLGLKTAGDCLLFLVVELCDNTNELLVNSTLLIPKIYLHCRGFPINLLKMEDCGKLELKSQWT